MHHVCMFSSSFSLTFMYHVCMFSSSFSLTFMYFTSDLSSCENYKQRLAVVVTIVILDIGTAGRLAGALCLKCYI